MAPMSGPGAVLDRPPVGPVGARPVRRAYAPERPAGPLLAEYPAFVRRHAWLLVACLCLGLLGGAARAVTEPARYSATAEVVVAQVPSYVTTSRVGRPPRKVTVDTDAQLVRSSVVARAVAAAGGTGQPVSDHLHVSAAPVSRVLMIRYTADRPEVAAAAANAAARAFVDERRSALGALQESQVGQLSYRIAQVQGRLAIELQGRQVVDVDDPLVRQLADLQDRLVDLDVARETPAEISREAVPPTRADHSNKEIALTSGPLIGLLAGCLLGVLRDDRRRRRDTA
jgi:uncharacterized protein involved in exopolysaccharide biosynthesis